MNLEAEAGTSLAMTAEQVSAWMDEPDTKGHPETLIAALGADGEARQCWVAYHLVGDALRSPEVAAFHSAGFAERLRERLRAEPTVLASPVRSRALRLRRYGSGVAIAASLVALGALVVPMMMAPSGPVPSLAGSQHAALSPAPLPDSALQGYFRAHLELAGGTAFEDPAQAVKAALEFEADR